MNWMAVAVLLYLCGVINTIAEGMNDQEFEEMVEELEREDDAGRIFGFYREPWVRWTGEVLAVSLWPIGSMFNLFEMLRGRQ